MIPWSIWHARNQRIFRQILIETKQCYFHAVMFLSKYLFVNISTYKPHLTRLRSVKWHPPDHGFVKLDFDEHTRAAIGFDMVQLGEGVSRGFVL